MLAHETVQDPASTSPVGDSLSPLSSAASGALTAEHKNGGLVEREHPNRQESKAMALGRVADSRAFFETNDMLSLLEAATGEKSCCQCERLGESCTTCRKVSQVAFTLVTSLALIPLYWRGSASAGVAFQLGCVVANVLQSILYGSETYTFLEQINNKPKIRSALAIALALITIYPPVSLTYLNEAKKGDAGLGVLFALMTFIGDLPLNIFSMYYFVNRIFSLFERTTARKYILDEMRAATNGGTGPSQKDYVGDPQFQDSIDDEIKTWVKVVGGILGLSIIGLGLAYGLTGYDCAAAAMFGGDGLGWTENPKDQLILGLMSNSPIILMSLLMAGMDNGIAILDALTKMKCRRRTSLESKSDLSDSKASVEVVAQQPVVSINSAASVEQKNDDKATLIPVTPKAEVELNYEKAIRKIQIAWCFVGIVAVVAARYSYATSVGAFETYCPDLFGKIWDVPVENFKNPTLGVGAWFAVSIQLIAAMTGMFNSTFGVKAVRGLYGAHKKHISEIFDKEKNYARARTDLQKEQVGDVASWVRSAPDVLVEREAKKLGWQRNPRWYDSCVAMFGRCKSRCSSEHQPVPTMEMPAVPAAEAPAPAV